MLLLFLFTGPGDPRDLHSFPTRRSSDLVPRRNPARRTSRRAVPPVSAMEGSGASLKRTSFSTVLAENLASTIERVKRARDRKSTRLNSSHVEISYAVFCLKKKKKAKNIITHAMAHQFHLRSTSFFRHTSQQQHQGYGSREQSHCARASPRYIILLCRLHNL